MLLIPSPLHSSYLWYDPPCLIANRFAVLASRWIHQPKDIVENEVATLIVRHELEGLRVAHGSPLGLDLDVLSVLISQVLQLKTSCVLTSSAPLTITRMPPVGLLGCASIVATWCSTFSNGRPCILGQYSSRIRNPLQNAYFQLLQYCGGPLAW